MKKSKNPKELISNKGNSKFLRIEGDSEIQLDEDRCAQAAIWDGLHGVVTNDPNLSPKQALHHYRGLWQVKESFRITKHDLKVRPVYHWTPDRIRAHLVISFMAFTCVRHLEYRVKLQHQKLSSEEIRSSLTRVQVSVLKGLDKQRYAIPSEACHEARKIYQVMGLRYSATPYRLHTTTSANS